MQIHVISLVPVVAKEVKPVAADFVSAHGCPTGCQTSQAFKAGIQYHDMALAVIKHWHTRDFTYDVWANIRRYSAQRALRDQEIWDLSPCTSYMATFTRWSRDYHTIIAEAAKNQMESMLRAQTAKEKAQKVNKIIETSWTEWALAIGTLNPLVAAYLANSGDKAMYHSLMHEYERLGGFTHNTDKDKQFFALYFKLHNRVHKCVLEFIQLANTTPKREHSVDTAHALRILFPGMIESAQK